MKANLERRADAAILCWCIGAGLLALAWVLGMFGTLAGVFSLGNPAAMASALSAALVAPITIGLGFLFCLVGLAWMVIRAIADQVTDAEGARYSKNVER